MTKFYTSVEPYGNAFRVRQVDDGIRSNRIVRGFVPDLFRPTNDESEKQAIGMDGKTMLAKLPCSNVREAKDLIQQYSGTSFDVYGSPNMISQFISKTYPGTIDFDPSNIRIFYLDMECYTRNPDGSSAGFPHSKDAKFPINLIQVIDSQDVEGDVVRIWGLQPFDDSESDIIYTVCRDESDLLCRFVQFWQSNCPDVMTGWNVKGFDVPYIVNRIMSVLGEDEAKKLSPWGEVRQRNYTNDFQQEEQTYIISGVAVLDYLELYKKYTYHNLENYKLDSVAHYELKSRKVDYSDLGSLLRLCDEDHDKFVEYGATDSRLILQLEQKMKLINLVFELAYHNKTNYADTFSPVRSWEAIIFNTMLDRNMYSTVENTDNTEQFRIEGGFVKQPTTGKMLEWVISEDFASLYPSLIMQYNISPETYLGQDYLDVPQFEREDLIAGSVDLSKLTGTNITMTPNRSFFNTENEGILPYLMGLMYAERKSIKREMLSVEREREIVRDKIRSLSDETAG